MHRYVSIDEDSGRWEGFEFRPGDIVISTRSKHGTTWMQMICLLLVHRTPELPAPLGELSPWLDTRYEDRDAVFARLATQDHRRVIKTHTPLDGVPLDERAHYVVVARHPLDAAVSLRHQGDNIDRDRQAELAGIEAPVGPSHAGRRGRVAEWLGRWIADEADPRESLDSLDGVFHHLRDAWERRGEDNVSLVHYQDLIDDLDGEMRRVAHDLGFDVDDEEIRSLVEAARFESMRSRAADLVPERNGVLVDPTAFFRQGRSGSGTARATADDLALYRRRAAGLAPDDLLHWLHRDSFRT